MMTPPREQRRLAFYFAALLPILAVTAGCVIDTAGPYHITGPDDPQVSDFQIRALTPAVSGRTIRWRITARITDRNNDVVGGKAEVSIHTVNGNGSRSNGVPVTPPGMSLTIVETDLTNGDRFTAILSMDNASAGDISMTFAVADAAGNRGVTGIESFDVRISGTSAPGAATRPDDIRGGLIHG